MLPDLHPSDMCDCNCNTGDEHRRAREESERNWTAAYERLGRTREPYASLSHPAGPCLMGCGLCAAY